MRVLGLDSSTPVATVALVDGEHLMGELFFNTGKTHSQRLVPMIDQLLDGAGLLLADIDAFAVAVGPGSFTGLRIGMATVKGLALATAKPVIGVPTLDALVENVVGRPGLLVPVLDARKNEVYTAVYESEQGENRRLTDYIAAAPCLLAERLTAMLGSAKVQQITFLGDAVPAYREFLLASFAPDCRFASPPLALPRASQVALLGVRRLQNGEVDDVNSLVPIYVRASEAEVLWARSHGVCAENDG